MNWWKVNYEADGTKNYYNVLANTADEAQAACEVQLNEDHVKEYQILSAWPTTVE